MDRPIQQSRPQPVGELRFEHTYFRKPRPGNLVRLEPDARSLRLGVEVRDTGDAFYLFRRERPGNASAPSRVGFGIQILDPEFFAYTRWDNPDNNPSGAAVRYLHPSFAQNNLLLPASAPLLPIRPRRFVCPLSQPTPNLKEASLEGIGAGNPFTFHIARDPNRMDCLVDASAVDSGGCNATFRFIDGTSDAVTFYVADAFRTAIPRLVLEWDVPLDGQQPPPLTVRFEALATFWRYFLIGVPAGDAASTSIRPAQVEGTPVTFLRTYPSVARQGLPPALVFQSSTPIPLSEAPRFKITVNSTGDWEGRVLPYPDKAISRDFDPTGRPILCTDVFVNG